MTKGTMTALAMSALLALVSGCEDPKAKASLEVCQQNREGDPRLAEILCEQAVEAAPGSPAAARASVVLEDLRAARVRREADGTEARRATLLAKNFVKSKAAQQ